MSAAWAHVARTVCRRAERRSVLLVESSDGVAAHQLSAVIVYLNRLSDYLFVLARYANQHHGQSDLMWEK